jgi:hypothetical protein
MGLRCFRMKLGGPGMGRGFVHVQLGALWNRLFGRAALGLLLVSSCVLLTVGCSRPLSALCFTSRAIAPAP